MTSSLNQGDDNPEEEKENFAVAIDLGTTYCCVGIWRDDKVEIVADEFGNRKTPCFVSFTDTETLIGEAAKDQLLVNPSNTLFDVMRLIGRRYSDAQVQEDIKLWPFIVTAGPDDKPVIGVNSQGQEKQFTAEEVLAMLLRKMVDIAAAFLGKPIQTAVVTIPAADFFTDHSRDAVKSAAKIAGFEVLRLVKEPIAAGVAYMSVEDAEILASSDVKTILVFNFGGRSLDIAVMTIDEVRIYDIMAQSTDLNLGGHNLDNRLMQHFAREIEMKFQENIFADSEALFSFRSVCEGLKRKLSSSSEATAEMSWKGFDIQLTITRDKFEEISMDLLNECVVQVERCLKTARTDKMKLDKVILVGGSSRIPKVQTLLQDFFCGKELCDAFNPDEVVAYGAAVTAWRIMNTVEQVDLLCGPDILPLNLGLETADGAMAVVISRNTYILPATRTEVFSTYTDYQKSVVLQIYEGQSIRAKDNHFIGTLELPRIVQSPQGSPQVEVTFKVDEDGLLTIVAEEKVAGVRKEITFGPSFTWSHSVFSGRLTWEQEVKLVEEGEEQRKGFADDSNYGTPSNKLLRG